MQILSIYVYRIKYKCYNFYISKRFIKFTLAYHFFKLSSERLQKLDSKLHRTVIILLYSFSWN